MKYVLFIFKSLPFEKGRKLFTGLQNWLNWMISTDKYLKFLDLYICFTCFNIKNETAELIKYFYECLLLILTKLVIE